MRQNPTDDELLRSYLLGEIPEPEADRLERRLLVEDDLFDLMEALEAELLASASRGELAPAERERVLRRLASSPEGRERLALARSLNAVADEKAATVVPFRRPEAGPKPVFRWAALAAAGLLAATGLFWFTQQTPQGGDFVPPIAHERPAPANPAQPAPREPAPPPVASAPAAPEPGPAPDRLAREDTDVPVARPEPVKAVLALALSTLRGAGGEEEPLRLSPETGVAEIQIDLEGLEDAGPFHAALRGGDRETIWEKSGLKAQKLDLATALVLEIPADLLAPGRYEVAITTSAEPDEMTQEFDVVRESR